MLEDGWQRAIDTSSVFVGGHSYGGPAALVAAVARSNPTFQVNINVFAMLSNVAKG